ncbi:XRE family transcriptional regulator, partial [Streptomyces californicus]
LQIYESFRKENGYGADDGPPGDGGPRPVCGAGGVNVSPGNGRGAGSGRRCGRRPRP